MTVARMKTKREQRATHFQEVLERNTREGNWKNNEDDRVERGEEFKRETGQKDEVDDSCEEANRMKTKREDISTIDSLINFKIRYLQSCLSTESSV